jgi:hypothetical protein
LLESKLLDLLDGSWSSLLERDTVELNQLLVLLRDGRSYEAIPSEFMICS